MNGQVAAIQEWIRRARTLMHWEEVKGQRHDSQVAGQSEPVGFTPAPTENTEASYKD